MALLCCASPGASCFVLPLLVCILTQEVVAVLRADERVLAERGESQAQSLVIRDGDEEALAVIDAVDAIDDELTTLLLLRDSSRLLQQRDRSTQKRHPYRPAPSGARDAPTRRNQAPRCHNRRAGQSSSALAIKLLLAENADFLLNVYFFILHKNHSFSKSVNLKATY